MAFHRYTARLGEEVKTALERYRNDSNYKRVVDMMTSLIVQNELTPAEMREAAVLASINYERMRIREFHVPLTPELHERLEELHNLIGAVD